LENLDGYLEQQQVRPSTALFFCYPLAGESNNLLVLSMADREEGAAEFYPRAPSQFLMRWLVLWLFADFVFRSDDFTETVVSILPNTFIAPSHPFVASRQ
jgi:hypothetical protein